jgi:hypothetical protein
MEAGRKPQPTDDFAPLSDVMKPGFHCVRTHWIWGFIAFQPARRTQAVMLMVPVRPESGFLGTCRAAAAHSLADREYRCCWC